MGDLERTKKVYDEQVALLSSIGYIEAVQDRLQVIAAEPSFQKPKKAILLALYHVVLYQPSDRFNTRYITQLVIFDAMISALGIARDVAVYDPEFNDDDRLFLDEMGFQAPQDAYGTEAEPVWPILEEPTFVWSPGSTPDGLYARNFDSEHLRNIIIMEGWTIPLAELRGKLAFINKGKSDEMTLRVVDAEVSMANEHAKRAFLVMEKRSMPSYHKLDVAAGKPTNEDHIGYCLDFSLTALYWVPSHRLKVMGDIFWNVPPARSIAADGPGLPALHLEFGGASKIPETSE